MGGKPMPRCCLYERNGEYRTVCTSDAQCPEIVGWSKAGNWGVDDCADCGGWDDPDDGRVVARPPGLPGNIREIVRVLEMAPLIVEALKKLGFDPTKPPKI
jgi:hypothetical protein